MKALRTPLITAGLLAALATSAFAQQGTDGMAGPGHRHGQQAGHIGKMHEHRTARHQQRLANLKAKLQLQPHQENAWKTFADAMQPPTLPGTLPDRVSMQSLSTPERIDQMLAVQEQRAAELKKRGEAAKAFHASLDAGQKKTFDNQFSQWTVGRSHHTGHRMGHH